MSSKHIPEMNWDSDNVAESFKIFKQRLELYFTTKNVAEDKQVPHILLQIGEKGLRMYNAMTLTADEQKDPKVVFQKLQEQVEPPEHFRVSRLKLMQMRQEKSETLDDFVTRAQLQAQKCEFSINELEERLIELIIASTPIGDFQKKLLGEQKGVRLSEVVKMGRTFEATDSHVQQLQNMANPTQASVSAIKSTPKGSHPCGNCGQRHKPKECPAYGTDCHTCGKPHHWKDFCRSGKQQPRHSFGGQRGRGQRRGTSGSRGGRGGGQQRKIKSMQADEENEDFDYQTFSTVTVSTVTSAPKRDEAFVKLKLKLYNRPGIHNIITKVDTGAQGNTLPLRLFREMFPDLLTKNGTPKNEIVQKKGSTKLTAYNGTDIPCHGKIAFPCRYMDEFQETEFYIVDVDGPAIIGLPSCESLRVVTLHCSITATPPVTKITCVQDLMSTNPEQFDRIGKIPGPVKLVVDQSEPPHIDAPRKTPIALKDAIKEELDSMVSEGVIRKVTEPTDWVSSLAYSKKKSGKLRICLDPRRLNQALKRPHHKIPTIEELTHQFCGSRFFSKLDAKSGYWSVQLDEDSQLLTTFQTPYGRYCFTRLPFGLKVSQDIFQLKMDQILENVKGATGISDDVVVYGKTEEEHDESLRNLMKAAKENGLVFNSEKCTIKTNSITFFGAKYTPEGVHPDTDKVNDLKAMPAPQNKKELQEFLGFITYMSPFIQNLAEKAAPLRELLKKDSIFIWEEHHQTCFQKLKDTVSEDATLVYFNTGITPVLETDASIKGLGVTLLQSDKPVAFASKTLTDAETRYACIERELLAIVYGVERFHTYLYGQKFTVRTDHKPLVMILQKPLVNAPPRLQRMLLRLQQYDFQIEYKPGKDMTLADTLSRLPSPGNKETIDLDMTIGQVRFSASKVKQLQEESKKDPQLSQLIPIIAQGWPESIKSLPEAIRSFWSFRDEISMEDGIILKGERVIIPQSLKQDTLNQLHAAHQGVEKTRLRARDSVYWHGISNDIESMISRCPICQEHQKSQTQETLHPHEIPTTKWEVLGADFFEFQGAHYLLIANYFTKFFVCRKMTSECSSKQTIAVFKQVFSEQDIPKTLYTDNGAQFTSKLFKDFAKEWSFNLETSSPTYPKSNGFIERQVQTVKHALTKAKQDGRDPELALLCIRATPLSPKIPSPLELLTGRKPRANLPTKSPQSHSDDMVRDLLQDRQSTQKAYHDKKAKDLSPLTPGQLVRFQDHPSSTWKEGVIREKCKEPRSYTLETPTGKTFRRNRVHIRSIPGSPQQSPEQQTSMPNSAIARTPMKLRTAPRVNIPLSAQPNTAPDNIPSDDHSSTDTPPAVETAVAPPTEAVATPSPRYDTRASRGKVTNPPARYR